MIYVCAVLVVLLGISVYQAVKLGIVILRMEDTIEECLDVIDERYESMTEILKRPLFYDSPEVRAVVKDIQVVRDSLHIVALSLTKNIEDEEKNE